MLVVCAVAGVQPQTEVLFEAMQKQGMPVIFFINKTDRVGADPDRVLRQIQRLLSENAFFLTDQDALTERLCDNCDDLFEKFLSGETFSPELLREKLLLCLDKEIPHGTAIEITKFSERDSGVIDVDATIFCEKASHKGIIIGKQGAMLKKISTMARTDCEKFMGTKVYLTTWVKVKENWRDSDFLVRNFGYSE